MDKQDNRRPPKDDRLIKDTRVLPEMVRLIDTRPNLDESLQNRVVSQNEAHRLRLESGLDLIMISPNANPPVIKLLDYGKFKYEEAKSKKEAQKKQHEQSRGMKEFYFGINIGDHDYQVKVTHIREAMEKNYSVRIGVKINYDTRSALRRGQTLAEAARLPDFILRRVITDCEGFCTAGKWSIGDRSSILIDLKKNV